MNTERTLPNCKDAEEAVIGVCLRNNAVIDEVKQIVAPQDFHWANCKDIFQAILNVYNTHRAVDLVLLGARLQEVKQFENVGGVLYLAKLWDEAPLTAAATQYAVVIRDRAVKRELIRFSSELFEHVLTSDEPAQDLLAEAERGLFLIAESRRPLQEIKIDKGVLETFNWADERCRKTLDGVLSGFVDFDALTGGFHSDELTLIAARPSVGKTALAVALARNVARQCPLLFVSLEQSARELVLRMACAESGVDSRRVRSGQMTREDGLRLHASGDQIAGLPIVIDETPVQNIQRIASSCRRAKRKHKIGFMILDYLQLVDCGVPGAKGINREQQVGQVSRALKVLSRELKIPLIVLCQLNRRSEDRAEAEPRLADLRDSGTLEQDADNVLLLWRPEKDDRRVVSCFLAKQRSGPIGRFKLTFIPHSTRFENHAEI